MVLALQGGMAVGKTTAARYTAAHASAVTVFFEDNAPALAALRGRGLDKHKFADYCEIQRAFIQQELDRYALAAVNGRIAEVVVLCILVLVLYLSVRQ